MTTPPPTALKAIKFSEFLHQYAATTERTWQHDRSQSVGGSEVFQCARRVAYEKNAIPHDESYEDDYGAKRRGQLIEDHWIVPALEATLGQHDLTLLLSGDDQRTMRDEYLTVTPDGLLVNEGDTAVVISDITLTPRDSMVVEFKTIDPRVPLAKPKPEHVGQVQAEIGIIRATTNYTPVAALLIYVDASWFSTTHEFVIQHDPAVYTMAKARAEEIMHCETPEAMRAEGRVAGGKECGYCPWQVRCGGDSVKAIPTKDDTDGLTDDQQRRILGAVMTERRCREKYEHEKHAHDKALESVKEALRLENVKRARLDGYTVSWNATAGRVTLDRKAAEADGIDLAPYEKTGRPSERLTIKVTDT